MCCQVSLRKHRPGQRVTPRWWTGRTRLSGTAHVDSRVAFFQPIGDRRAIVNGYIVMIADEIQAIIRALRDNDIQAFSLHTHALRTASALLPELLSHGHGASLARRLQPAFAAAHGHCPSREQPLTHAPLRRTIGVTRVRQAVGTPSRDERGGPKSGDFDLVDELIAPGTSATLAGPRRSWRRPEGVEGLDPLGDVACAHHGQRPDVARVSSSLEFLIPTPRTTIVSVLSASALRSIVSSLLAAISHLVARTA